MTGAVVVGAVVVGTVGGVVIGVVAGVVVLGLVGGVGVVTGAVEVVEVVEVVGVVLVGSAVTLGPSGESTRLIVDDFGTPQLAITIAQETNEATQIHGAFEALIRHRLAG